MSDACPRILPLGEAALSVEFGDRIDEAANARVHALDALLSRSPLPAQRETVPSYRALLVVFEPATVDLPRAAARLSGLSRLADATPVPHRRWRVPILYGGTHGPDLDAIAAHCGLSAEGYAARHAAGRYRVHMLGFQPGFSYLGGLDPALAMPRRATPRARIASRSVSVGGVQTAIGTAAGPSGWHVVGRTPLRPFRADRDPACLFAPGDEILFEAIDECRYAALEAAAREGAEPALPEPPEGPEAPEGS